MPREILRFARRVMVKVKPDRVDEFISVMRRNIYPKLRRESGLRRIYLLQPADRSGEFVSLTLWSNERDLENYGRTHYKENLDTIREFIDEEPTVTKLKIETHAVGQIFKKVPTKKKSRRRAKR